MSTAEELEHRGHEEDLIDAAPTLTIDKEEHNAKDNAAL